MRALAVSLMVLSFAASSALARTGEAGDKAGTTATETSSATVTANSTPNEPAAASKADSPAKPAESNLEGELQELRDLIEAQSKQIQVQNEQLKEEQQQMQTLENQLKVPSSGGSNISATTPVSAVLPSSSSMTPNGIAPNAPVSSNAAVSPSAPAKPAANQGASPDQPASLSFKGITLTPGGYFAAETVWRNRAIGSGINSAFNGVPLPGNDQSHITEFNASGRQSRIAMLAQGKLSSVTIGGYYEGDFLSAGTTSNENQSNSYTFRQRQFWGQARFNSGWTITGGQMWSLVTETKTGVDNRTEATTQTIDAQYNVGFSWARQYGLRVAKNFSNKVWLAASVEEAQTTLTVHNQNNNFLVRSFGIGGGLYNPVANYAFNAAPDFIVKAALSQDGDTMKSSVCSPRYETGFIPILLPQPTQPPDRITIHGMAAELARTHALDSSNTWISARTFLAVMVLAVTDRSDCPGNSSAKRNPRPDS